MTLLMSVSDIDECLEKLDDCGASTLCVNNYGSFDCRQYPICPVGHRFNLEERYCKGLTILSTKRIFESTGDQKFEIRTLSEILSK